MAPHANLQMPVMPAMYCLPLKAGVLHVVGYLHDKAMVVAVQVCLQNAHRPYHMAGCVLL